MKRSLIVISLFLVFLCVGQRSAAAKGGGGEDQRGLGCVRDIQDRAGNLAFQNNCDEKVHVLWYVNSHMHGGNWVDAGTTDATYTKYSAVTAADEPFSYYACPAGFSPVDAYGSYAGDRHVSSWHCHR